MIIALIAGSIFAIGMLYLFALGSRTVNDFRDMCTRQAPNNMKYIINLTDFNHLTCNYETISSLPYEVCFKKFINTQEHGLYEINSSCQNLNLSK